MSLGCPQLVVPSPALLFDGSTNPAHPKHIGSIDPHCNVANVVRGWWGLGSHPHGRGGIWGVGVAWKSPWDRLLSQVWGGLSHGVP